MRVTLDVQTSLALFRRIFEYLDLEPAIVERPGAAALPAAGAGGSVEFARRLVPLPGAARAERHRPAADRGSRGGRAASDRARRSSGDDDVQRGRRATAGRCSTCRCGSSRASSPRSSGPSGSGKTTMTYLVPRFYDVTEGAVLVDGIDVRDLTMDSLAETVGMVTQEPYLFHGTIYDNIAYARPDATEAEVHQAARERQHPRPDHELRRRLRHDHRRARLPALRRGEAAAGDRPGVPDGPARADPRRGHVGARHRDRAAGPGRARARHPGPDDHRHRAPALDHPERRRHLRPRGRRAGRAGHPRRAARPRRPLRTALHRAVRRRARSRPGSPTGCCSPTGARSATRRTARADDAGRTSRSERRRPHRRADHGLETALSCELSRAGLPQHRSPMARVVGR